MKQSLIWIANNPLLTLVDFDVEKLWIKVVDHKGQAGEFTYLWF